MNSILEVKTNQALETRTLANHMRWWKDINDCCTVKLENRVIN